MAIRIHTNCFCTQVCYFGSVDVPGFGTRRDVDHNDFLFIHGSDGSCGLELSIVAGPSVAARQLTEWELTYSSKPPPELQRE